MIKLWTYLMSMMLMAMLATFSGATIAGPGSAVLAATTVYGQDEVQQSDPGTPPDCKKYPKDPRCKGKN